MYARDGGDVFMSFKLEFPCSNNKVKYEALDHRDDLYLADENS